MEAIEAAERPVRKPLQEDWCEAMGLMRSGQILPVIWVSSVVETGNCPWEDLDHAVFQGEGDFPHPGQLPQHKR